MNWCSREIVYDDQDADDEKEADNENDNNLLGNTLLQTESVGSELHIVSNQGTQALVLKEDPQLHLDGVNIWHPSSITEAWWIKDGEM